LLMVSPGRGSGRRVVDRDHVSLREQARRQGVRPVESAEDLAADGVFDSDEELDELEQVIYCTARIDAAENPSGYADQDIYLEALRATGSVDHIEYGHYVARVKTAPLAVREANG
jgi:hypothetical protein